jgi:hypothetical protein
MIDSPAPILLLGKVSPPIGLCQNSRPVGSSLGDLSRCKNAPSSTSLPMSPGDVASRAGALADLRAARTMFRHLKARWLEHYDPSQLQSVLDRSRADWQSGFHGPADKSWQIPTTILRAARRQSGYQQFVEAESGRIKDLSSMLRRRLIEDGFADSTMIDRQIAYDLGL